MSPPVLSWVAASLLGTAVVALTTAGDGAATRGWEAGVHIPFRDGPPARVTGGFGEDSCYACHWDGTENDGVGTLEVSGFPEAYLPGERYPLEVTLRHPDLIVAGFQLAVRKPDGEIQAGDLAAAGGEESRTTILVEREVAFAHHTLAGSEPSHDGESHWLLHWTAPETGTSDVYLHVSALAGDGDESQMGDAVYTQELRSRSTLRSTYLGTQNGSPARTR